jgi:hypothetical protein
MEYKLDKAGIEFVKFNNFRIESTPTEKFPSLCTIVKGPSFGRELFGKKYIILEKAIGAIAVICGERLIDKGAKGAKEEMAEMGLIVEDEADIILAS